MRLSPLCGLVLVACVDRGDDTTIDDTDGAASLYADDAMWACLPGSPGDVCAYDIAATELLPNGDELTVTPERVDDPPFDCFYAYPTVDLFSGGLDTDFSEPGARLDPLLSQAAPFTGLCHVYAPYYRQVALNAFSVPGLWDEAYGDVLDAFQYFLAHQSHGRPFALIGHSQGTAHLTRLLAEQIDDDPALRSRLVAAVLLGGSVQVPTGEVVGGTFANTPLCTTPGQAGCVMAWNTYAAEAPPSPSDLFGYADPGQTIACTDPRLLAGNTGKVAGTWFPTQFYGPAFTNIDNPYAAYTTPFVRVRDSLDAACVTRDDATYLEVTAHPADGDTRPAPPYRNTLQEAIGFGMHGLDFNVPIEDLLTAVSEIDVAAMQAEQ